MKDTKVRTNTAFEAIHGNPGHELDRPEIYKGKKVGQYDYYRLMHQGQLAIDDQI